MHNENDSNTSDRLRRIMMELGISENLDEQFFVFRIGPELFATPLLAVREVVYSSELQRVPNGIEDFLGLVNLKGHIVGVIDLAGRLGFEEHKVTVEYQSDDIGQEEETEVDAYESEGNPENGHFLVFETEAGILAAAVSEVTEVAHIVGSKIEHNPPTQCRIEPKFLLGVTMYKGHLITIIDLKAILAQQDLVAIEKVAS